MPDEPTWSKTEKAIAHQVLKEIGARLATLGRELGGRPLFAVLEGGYATELPACVAGFVVNWLS